MHCFQGAKKWLNMKLRKNKRSNKTKDNRGRNEYIPSKAKYTEPTPNPNIIRPWIRRDK